MSKYNTNNNLISDKPTTLYSKKILIIKKIMLRNDLLSIN